ncbi:coil containing protein [Vibrio phage 2.117.O._10N.261.45.E9]|nr:coil containing protein [Vibrio phage 1.117.O._10N.261.45.E9]AUR95441.1 coil containing protein [Vibrio phage 1.207.B._10N.222.51.C2]AUS02332.1 coil containing protein [Vibrio phage 2.117.O._10N.261.45.E9]
MTDYAKLGIKVTDQGTEKATGNLDKLTAASGKAEKATTKFAKAFNSGAKLLAGAAVAGAGALTLLYKAQAAAIDQTAKHADSLGISTEALTQFRHAAELTGLGADGLDVSLQRLTRRTNDAAAGNVGLQKAYNSLNVDVNALAQMKPEEQMFVMADAFAGVEDRAERVRLAFQLFGREGIQMVNMFENGAEGLREMTDEADALGLTLSRIDAAKVEAANDAMYRATAIGTAFSREITVQLAPVVAALADEFRMASQEAGGMNEVVMSGIEIGVKGGSYIATAYRGAVEVFKALQITVKAVEIGFMEMTNWVASNVPELGTYIAKGLTYPIRTALQALSLLSDTAADALVQLEAMTTLDPITPFDPKELNDSKLELNQMIWELRTLASEPLPHEGVDEWLARVRSSAQEAAEAIAASRAQMRNVGVDTSGDNGMGAKELERVRTELLTQEEAIKESYARREKIILDNTVEGSTKQLDLLRRAQDQRDAQLNEGQVKELETIRKGLLSQEELMLASYESQRAALMENTLITEEERGVLLEGIHDQYMARLQVMEAERQSLILSSAGNIFDGLAGITSAFAGEQNALYKTMFAASKAFAIADSIIKIQQGMAAAAATPWPANIAAIGSVVAATSGIVSTISGTEYSGAYDKGGNIPSGGFGLVGEYGPELVKGPANITGREATMDAFKKAANGDQSQSSSAVQNPTNIRIINSVDPQMMADAMGSTEGEKVIMNVLKRNNQALKRMTA